MNCADLEILICDYVDGTLDAAKKAEVERHLGGCPACAELARDSAAAVAFIERSADVEPPPELITRILFDAPWTKERSGSKLRNWIRTVLSPVLQPKLAMGIAMTMITLSFLWQYAVPKQLHASDLQPTKVWAGLEDRAYYAWGRTVKFYENLKFVYQIQTMLREWQQQDEEQQPKGAPKASTRPAEERKLPVKSAPDVPGAGGATPANASPSNRTGGSQ
jgi:hypothetical protein